MCGVMLYAICFSLVWKSVCVIGMDVGARVTEYRRHEKHVFRNDLQQNDTDRETNICIQIRLDSVFFTCTL
jgi:hypothetical protein